MSASVVLPLLAFGLVFSEGRVLELDGNKFLELRHQRNWLLEFYAPWCGYCKRLAPVWDEVGKALSYSGSNVTVAKLDATRFNEAARQFEVHGFPTILFVRGHQVYTHHGGRTLPDILQFAEQAKGPAVRWVKSAEQFREVVQARKEDVFYLYAGPDQDPAYEKYQRVAEERILQGYFYAVADRQWLSPPLRSALSGWPAILVVKDSLYLQYQGEDDEAGVAPVAWSALKRWVERERYPPFVRVSGSNIGEVAASCDWLVMGMLDPALGEDHPLNQHIKTTVKALAERQRERFPGCQFGWTTDGDMVDSIMMWDASIPGVMIFDTASHQYYLPDKPVHKLQSPHLADYIKMAINGNSIAYGGNTFSRKILRVFYQTSTGVTGLFKEHPLMASLTIFVPGVIISFMVYLICCGGLVEDEEGAERESDGSEDGEDEDREQNEEEEEKSAATQHLKSE